MRLGPGQEEDHVEILNVLVHAADHIELCARQHALPQPRTEIPHQQLRRVVLEFIRDGVRQHVVDVDVALQQPRCVSARQTGKSHQLRHQRQPLKEAQLHGRAGRNRIAIQRRREEEPNAERGRGEIAIGADFGNLRGALERLPRAEPFDEIGGRRTIQRRGLLELRHAAQQAEDFGEAGPQVGVAPGLEVRQDAFVQCVVLRLRQLPQIVQRNRCIRHGRLLGRTDHRRYALRLVRQRRPDGPLHGRTSVVRRHAIVDQASRGKIRKLPTHVRLGFGAHFLVDDAEPIVVEEQAPRTLALGQCVIPVTPVAELGIELFVRELRMPAEIVQIERVRLFFLDQRQPRLVAARRATSTLESDRLVQNLQAHR